MDTVFFPLALTLTLALLAAIVLHIPLNRWVGFCKPMPPKKKDKTVALACSVCKERNYRTGKNPQAHPDRLELKKYCSRCGAHTLHRETK